MSKDGDKLVFLWESYHWKLCILFSIILCENKIKDLLCLSYIQIK